jgi:hypothetical protein
MVARRRTTPITQAQGGTMQHVRRWARLSFFAPLLLLSLSYSAHAAGYYAESFGSSPPADWVAATDTWSATNGYYTNGNSGELAMAYYSARRWTTDFTYSLRMNSDLQGNGERRVGVVFNVVDQNNYYLVAISMAATIQQNVQLYQVVGGVRSAALATGHSDIPATDTWFDVAIVRSGVNTVKVRIGNEQLGNQQEVLNYDQLPSAPAGYIGVLVEWNWGRFDDVQVAPVVFRTGFNTGVNVTTPVCVGPTNEKKYQVDLSGTESGTGTVWPPTFWGQPNVVLMNTILGCTDANGAAKAFTDYLDVRFKGVTSPYGDSTRVLTNTVKNVTPQTEPYVQNQIPRLGLGYDPVDDVPWQFYVRRYLKYVNVCVQEPCTVNLAAPPPGKWFVQHEFKNESCSLAEPPRRLTLYWHTNSDGEPYYRLRMDKSNNQTCDIGPDPIDFPEQTCYPTRGENCPNFITGQWFYDEYFVKYSQNGTTGDRVAYAINGQKIFDYTSGPVKTSRARGIKLTPGYLNFPNVEVRVDDLEVYHYIPCRTFPCGPPPRY